MAQTDEPTRPVGRLYFNATEMASEGSPDCGDLVTYGMNTTTPSGSATGDEEPESKKAYLALSYGALACPTYFEYNVTDPIQLEGDAQVLIHFACDGTTVNTGSSSGNKARATLLKNGEEVEDATATVRGGPELCSDEAENFTITLPTMETAFEEEDLLTIELLFWAVNDGESLHALVETMLHNTSITAAGLPMEQGAPLTGNETGGNQTGNQTGGNQTGGNQTGNQTGPTNTTSARTTSPSATATTSANETSTDEPGRDLDDDPEQTQDISGEADTPGPGLVAAAAMIAGSAWLAHRRHRRGD